MFYSPDEIKQRAEKFCNTNKIKLGDSVGHGTQGIVYFTSRNSAIKVHCNKEAYIRERNVYQRLNLHNVTHVRSLIVPNLRGYDDVLFVIEMSLVSPPFLLDFGGAYLDEPPAYARDPELVEQWENNLREVFEEDYDKVAAVLADLQIYGIFVSDVNPGNIKFSKE